MAQLIDPKDPSRALMLLTRLPVPCADGTRGAASAWAWPLVGLVVGALGAGVAWAGLGFGLSPNVAAGMAIGTTILSTGALHEDGLADCADGFWGGHDPTQRLEIMKDSRIGAYGVLVLILTVVLKWTMLAELIPSVGPWVALLIPAILSRGAMVWMMATLPFARDGGLARQVGQPAKSTAAIGVALAAVLTVTLGGWAAAVSILAVASVGMGIARLARIKIGGQTGDVLGATQQLTELAVLLTLAIALPS